MSGQAQRFEFDDVDRSVPDRLDLPDADVVFTPAFLDQHQHDRLWAALLDTTMWRQETIKLYGREGPVPRLTAWYGDPGTVYAYSSITMQPEPWSPALREVKALVEQEAGVAFNSVLCNLYRHGRDSVAWHSDDESELGPRPVIASVSLGASRLFQLRHKERPDQRRQIELPGGSLLLMRGPTQRHWRHQVPKTSRVVGPRINLTFRAVGARVERRRGPQSSSTSNHQTARS